MCVYIYINNNAPKQQGSSKVHRVLGLKSCCADMRNITEMISDPNRECTSFAGRTDRCCSVTVMCSAGPLPVMVNVMTA